MRHGRPRWRAVRWPAKAFNKRVNNWLNRTDADPPEPKDLNHAI